MDDFFGKPKHLKMETEEIERIMVLDNSAAKHKLSVRPHRKYADSRQRNVSDATRRKEDHRRMERLEDEERSERSERSDISCKREAVVKELLETEDEFCRDLNFVVENYVKPSDGPAAPLIVRDNTDLIFSNLKQISDFHSTILNEGIKYYSDEPRMLGKTFLRLERDFDKHIAYCRDVPLAQEFLANNPQATEFFEELSQKSGDGKNILEYLKLPVQRINDYQVLLKDLVKYSEKLQENSNDLKKALELMLAIPQRANDNKFLSNIEGFHGNIHNLGRLLHHDWFSIEFEDSGSKERYLFLFKDHIIVCKVKKISEDRSVFLLKDLITLSEVRIRDCSDGKSFEIVPKSGHIDRGPVKVQSRKETTKNCWFAEIKKCSPSAFEQVDVSKEKSENVFSINQSKETEEIKVSTEKESEPIDSVVHCELNEKEEDKAGTMSRRFSTRKSMRTYEESYSVSGQHETYIQSSRRSASKYASASIYDSSTSACETYESSLFSTSNRSGAVVGGDTLAITSGDKPIFTRTITGLHLEPGDTAAFECQLQSEARLTWLKDNKALEDKLADRVIRSSSDDGTHRLELQNVTEADTGTYTALAQNDSNFATCTAHLLVEKVSTEEAQRRKEATAPYFAVRLKDTDLMKNTNFTFVVKVKGNPNPDVKFYKDDIPIRDGKNDIKINREKSEIGFYELTISDVQRQHAGVYTCKASNSLGEAQCEATVTITDEKVVFKGLENESLVTPGEKPSFTWFKDGKSFDPDERFKVLLGNEDDSLALIFQHVKPDDAGLYTCVASTTAGKISCSAELSVQGAVNPLPREPEKPNISKVAKSVEAEVGGSALLEAKVTGFPRPDIKWYHEGKEIAAEGRYKFLYEDQDTMTLIIKNLNTKDGGTYKIIAKNELGDDVTEVDLIVKGAPKIKKKMTDITVKVKETIEIETEIEGCPTPVVKWYKDGKEISESERIKIVSNSSSDHYKLIIKDAETGDEGSYSVTASNEVNRCTDFCQVKVRSAPKISKKMEKKVNVSEGEDIVFEIEVDAESSTEVKWMKDGVELKSDGKKVIITDDGSVHTLRIVKADASDSTEYSVEVKNDDGKTSDSGEAVVSRKTCAPIFKKGLTDTTAKEGDTGIEFSVEVTAFPKPKIRWYLDEMEITEKRNEYAKLETDNNYKLIMKKVTTEMTGTYKCKVENECGSAETTAKLTVHSKPVFVKFPEPKITVDEGSELTLQIECKGCPEPEISWFKDGQEVQTDAHIKIQKDSHRSESYSMTLNLIRESDGGNYEARATNCMGSATTETYVQVFSKIFETSEDDAEGVFKPEKIEEHPQDALFIEPKKLEIQDEHQEEEKDEFSVMEKPKKKLHYPVSFSQVKVEEIEENNWDEEKGDENQGIVEECVEEELPTSKLTVNRGISIVSVSDDEKPLSRTSSGGNLNEEKDERETNDFVDESRHEKAKEKSEEVYQKSNAPKPEENLELEEPKPEEQKPDEPQPTGDSMPRKLEPEEIETKNFEPRESKIKESEPEKLQSEKIEFMESEPEKPKFEELQPMEFKPKKTEFTEPEPTERVEDKGQSKDSSKGEEADAGSDFEEDAVVSNLLRRIKQQRSVLEDILEKESESKKGGKEEKPRFIEQLNDKKCTKKEEVTFKCIVAGNPEPELTWTHNDKVIKEDNSRIKIKKQTKETSEKIIQVTCELKILDVDSDDAGYYAVTAQNSQGATESKASLSVQSDEKLKKPEIKNLKDIATMLSEDVTFEAKIESDSAFTVTWLNKNEEKLEENDHIIFTKDEKTGVYKMTIKNTKAEDIGEYYLVATNEVGDSKQKAQLTMHGEIPSFVKLVEDTEVVDGRDVEFLVRCNGIPKPELKWFKNGKELIAQNERVQVETHAEGQVSSWLKIQKFETEDVGEYKVVATNVMGTAENKFKLKMSQTSPTFEKGLPRTLEVDDGLIELKCKVSGSPKPAVKWLKDGIPLTATEGVNMIQLPDGTLKLTIESATPEDSGKYTVDVENPNGKITAQCAVSVLPKPSKPKFVESLKDVSGEEGQPIRLETKIISFPLPELKWFKDGKPLKSSQGVQNFDEKTGKVELVINAIKPENAGVYSVKAVNKLGEATQEANVQVVEGLQKPKFTTLPKPVVAVEGSPVKFSVKASGNPKPTIHWHQKGEPLEADGNNVMIKEEPDETVSLLLKKCSLEDAGEFVATAVNDQGEASCKAPLTVTPKKTEVEEKEPSFVGPLNSVKIDEGNDFVLSATISGNPVPDVSWEKDGTEVSPSHRILPACDGKKVSLEVKSCKPSDSGVYTCHLRNSAGTSHSKGNVQVRKIFKEPVFEEKFKDLNQIAGDTATFAARISGNPKPDVDWYFNGEIVKAGDKYQIKCEGDWYKLVIKNCTGLDGGLYRCSAHNRAGKADCVAHLNVSTKKEEQLNVEPPYFLKKVSDCDVYDGMTAKFTACCAGSPAPDYEWYKDDVKLQPSSRIKMSFEDSGLVRLSVSGATANDVGTYRLRISNPHGSAECSGKLTCDTLEKRPKKKVTDKQERVSERPSGVPAALTDRPIISRMTDRHLTLSWKPYLPLGPHPPVTYIIEMCIQPDGDWFTVRKGIRSCACDIRNLEPFRDYKFRVRVENKYGISDPSPYAETFRQKIIPDSSRFKLGRGPNVDYRPEGIPKDFEFDRPIHEGYKQAPEFLRQQDDIQYGVKNQNSSVNWYVYGYPKPTITYLFNGEPVEMGGRFDCSYTRNGLATLFINRMLDRDVGEYEAIARNEHGEARQKVRLEIGEHPIFIRRPEETHVMIRGSGSLTVRVFGVPFPEVKWYKDWQPLAPSSRIKFHQPAPDTFVLTINDAIFKDEGLYSVSVSNLIGTVSSSAMLHIEENEEIFGYKTYEKGRDIRPRREPHSNLYDIGDELGRGTQGITYHAVERRSGQNFAAKFMHGRSELKPFMMNELNIMNSLNHRKLIRLHDAFETNDLIVIIEELAGGGELLEWLIKQTYITEREIANYVRQILWGLDYMHTNGYAHLSLTLNDLLLSRIDGDDLKICDFGLSRRITRGSLLALHYGMPEFVSPEVVNGEGVDYSTDMWSLGIITYILLSGFSPFRGVNDRETLTRIKEGKWEFREDYFVNISSEARDFITKLLAYRIDDRMDVKTALKHPWLERADRPADLDEIKIETTNLKNYYSQLRNWYKNASCKPWYRRQPLSNAFTHPSKMVYPPGDYDDIDVPAISPGQKEPRERIHVNGVSAAREPLEYEVGNFKSESQYQNGPDTYLLQLRDVDLPCRLRHYMKVAADRQSSFPVEPPERHIDWRTPVIRERRKFMDIMDEEIDDERRARISKYGSEDVQTLRRLKHEIGCRSDGHAEAEAMLEYKRDGRIPFFREKPRNMAIIQNDNVEISCLVVGDPAPIVQWFKNDLVLGETSRIKMTNDEKGKFSLKFEPALRTDVATYKAVAKNKVGQSTARMRLVLATVPLPPDPPEVVQVSDTEILLEWKHESDDVFTPIISYSLQYKESDKIDWIKAAENIGHEFWLLKNLKPGTCYDLRLLSKNCAGWSTPGEQVSSVSTKESGASKVEMSDIQRKIQSETEAEAEANVSDTSSRSFQLNYEEESSPVEWNAGIQFEDKYKIHSEVARGEFSSVVKASDKSTAEQVAAKIFDVNSNTEKLVADEFEMLRSLKHERIANLMSALRPAPNVAVFIMEKLEGSDILSYFASRKEYDEDMVVTGLTQVLDALQYLHWRGICHLNLQPDNIVLCSSRSLQIKLVDFGAARKVSKLGTHVINVPFTDYSAPEILCNEAAFPQTDLWSLGTVAYVLLSGVSPFKGETDEETQQNIIFVRYRFEHLFKEITQEATRFLMQIFKRTPSKRPTVEECYETRWFLSSEFVIKKRQKACFPGSRLKEYSDLYHAKKVKFN